jgi:hypothetical protein
MRPARITEISGLDQSSIHLIPIAPRTLAARALPPGSGGSSFHALTPRRVLDDRGSGSE